MKKGEVVVKYFPTKMIGLDILTKPLKGAALKEMMAILMDTVVDCDNQIEGAVNCPSLCKFEKTYHLVSAGEGYVAKGRKIYT